MAARHLYHFGVGSQRRFWMTSPKTGGYEPYVVYPKPNQKQQLFVGSLGAVSLGSETNLVTQLAQLQVAFSL